MAEIDRLETWLAPLLQRLSDSERAKLAREVARDLRSINAANIRAQRGPDGEKWEARKSTREPNKPIRWIYKARDGHVRELEMSSWRGEGDRVIGYDKEAGAIRTMLREGMIKKMSPQHGSAPTAAQRRRAQLMMLGMVKKLQASAQGADAVVQFLGRTERIARVHHLGLRDRVKPGGPEYDYPQRPLMGFPQGYEDQLKDRILAHLAGR